VLKYVPSWVPGAGFQRQAKKWRKVTRDLFDLPFAQAKQKITMGTAPHSFISVALNESNSMNTTEQERCETIIKAVAANMYAAGADTTVSTLGTFVLGMVANPDAQRKAQAELDAVVGKGQLPDFADEPSLPYTTAIVKEALRWKNVAPFSVPHFVAVEDEYRGYRIPAGSIVIGNTWAIMHDEEIYPDPYSFKPERFLLNGKLNPAVRDPDVAAFGYGRRICPGKNMANASLWITIASILATLDIKKAPTKVERKSSLRMNIPPT